MLISDWSSDVCSSGLIAHLEPVPRRLKVGAKHLHLIFVQLDDLLRPYDFQIGRYDVDECLRLDRAQVRPPGLDTAFGGTDCRSPPPTLKNPKFHVAVHRQPPAAGNGPPPSPEALLQPRRPPKRRPAHRPAPGAAPVPRPPPPPPARYPPNPSH